jgi:hypothetical protein
MKSQNCMRMSSTPKGVLTNSTQLLWWNAWITVLLLTALSCKGWMEWGLNLTFHRAQSSKEGLKTLLRFRQWGKQSSSELMAAEKPWSPKPQKIQIWSEWVLNLNETKTTLQISKVLKLKKELRKLDLCHQNTRIKTNRALSRKGTTGRIVTVISSWIITWF